MSDVTDRLVEPVAHGALGDGDVGEAGQRAAQRFVVLRAVGDAEEAADGDG